MASSLCAQPTITQQIRLCVWEQHRCLLSIKSTDDSYWENVAEVEGKPHYQVGLFVFSLVPLCEAAF